MFSDLEIQILEFLHEKDGEVKFTEVVEALSEHQALEEDSDKERSLRVKIHRNLQSFVKDGLIERHKISHKDVRYGIKNHARAILILAASSQRVKQILEEPSPYKMKITLPEKTPQRLAEVLMTLAFGKRPLLQPFAPLTIRFGAALKDRLLMILPDQKSAQKLRSFTDKEFEDLTNFLTMAFGMFIQGPGRASFSDTVIIKFTPKQLQKLKNYSQSLDQTVFKATQKYAGNCFLLPRIEDLPATREAIKKGKFASQEGAYTKYILEGEKNMARRLLLAEG